MLKWVGIKILGVIVFLFCLFCLLLLKCALQTDILDAPNKRYHLQKDGFVVMKDVLSNEEVAVLREKCYENDYYNAKKQLIHNYRLLDTMKSYIGDNQYVFQDYIWIIKKSSVHTCHRDNNGDFFNAHQKHPSYTVLIYLEDAEKCLGVVPNSHVYPHSFSVNFSNVVHYLPCKKGDAILFNANLIHVGALNKQDNLRIQMKVSHKDDLQTLSYYQNYNKVLERENNVPFMLKHIQKNASCMFPFLSNLTQNENIRTARGTDNGVQIGMLQKIFSYLFYGNSEFYVLPNAF